MMEKSNKRINFVREWQAVPPPLVYIYQPMVPPPIVSTDQQRPANHLGSFDLPNLAARSLVALQCTVLCLQCGQHIAMWRLKDYVKN